MSRHSTTTKTGLALTLLLVVAPSAFAYQTVGIIDRAGKIIVPYIYHRIEATGRGFYYVEEMDQENPLKWSYRGRILDNNGKEIKVITPRGCTLSKVFFPDSTYDCKIDRLPTETILEIHSSAGFGLSRLNGDIILEPKYGAIGEPSAGFFAVMSGNPFSRTTLLFTLNSKTGARVSAPNGVTLTEASNGAIFPFERQANGSFSQGYMARDGRVVIQPQYVRAGQFGPNGVANVSDGRIGSFYIDESGKVLSPIYQQAGDFVGGYAVVRVMKNRQIRSGLINTKFQFVLQPEYVELSHMFDQVYASKRRTDDPFTAITSGGKTLFEFPPETLSIYGGEDFTGCTIKTDTGTIKYVLVDRAGKIAATTDARLLHFDFGMAVVGKKSPNNHTEWKVVDRTGEVIQPFQKAFFKILSTDRILKSVQLEHFSAGAWTNPSPMGASAGLNRFSHFAYFLMDFDLIGMPRKTVEKLLGPSERPSICNFYYLGKGQCDSSWTGVELEFEADKAVRWREVWNPGFIASPLSAPWVTQNMVSDPNQDIARKNDAEPTMKLRPKDQPNISEK